MNGSQIAVFELEEFGAGAIELRRSWPASLSLDFYCVNDKTYVHRSHRGPLSIQRPFYPEQGVCHVTLLHPPGGVVSGDRLLTTVVVNPNAHAVVVAPGATKHYRSRSLNHDGPGTSSEFAVGDIDQRLVVDGGSLEWLPNESIHFNGSATRVHTRVELSGRAAAMGIDVQVFGRSAGDHPFTVGDADLRLSVYRQGHPLWLDRLLVTGTDDLKRLAGMQNCTVYGTLWSTHANDDLVDRVRQGLSNEFHANFGEQTAFAVTRIDELLLIRYLGTSSEVALAGLRRARDWIRPVVFNKSANTPRIWST